MATPVDDPAQVGKIESWKGIAAYLKKDISTVQRWARSEGLPVHRHHHLKKSSVYAYKSELDAWLQGKTAAGPVAAPEETVDETEPPAPPPTPEPRAESKPSNARRLAIAAVTLLIAVSVLSWTLRSRPTPQPDLHHPGGRLFLSAARENARPTIISVAGGDVQGMLAIPSRHELWVSCPKEKMIAIVDTQSLALTGQISVPVGDRPTPFALSPDQSTVYVTAKHGEILTISTATRQFHSIPIARRIGDLALSADGRYLYIAAVFEGLKKVDTSTGRVTNIETAIAPTFLAVDPTRNLLYIAYRNGGPTGREGHDAIGILDLNNDKSVGILQGPPLVGGHLAVSPGGEFLLADGTDACYQPRYDHAGCPGTGPVIQVFHLPTHQLTKTILAQPSDWVSPISFTPDASAILTGGNHLRAYDARSFNAEEYSPDWLGSNNGMFAFAGDHLFMQIEGRGIAALPLDQGRSDPPQTGLTSFWPGEGVPADIAGLNNAICTPAVRYVPGRVGQAFGFEGKDARCEVNSTRRFLFTAEPGTISFWAKLSSRRGEMVLLDQSDRDEQVGWQILVDARNTLIFQYISPGQSRLTSAKPLQPETWHHIAVTRTDTSISLYLDAILQSSTPVRATPDPAKHLTFGSTSNGSSPFYGKLDDIAFHLRALEHAELLRAAQSK